MQNSIIAGHLQQSLLLHLHCHYKEGPGAKFLWEHIHQAQSHQTHGPAVNQACCKLVVILFEINNCQPKQLQRSSRISQIRKIKEEKKSLKEPGGPTPWSLGDSADPEAWRICWGIFCDNSRWHMITMSQWSGGFNGWRGSQWFNMCACDYWQRPTRLEKLTCFVKLFVVVNIVTKITRNKLPLFIFLRSEWICTWHSISLLQLGHVVNLLSIFLSRMFHFSVKRNW